jgi:hypothetical protein
LAGTRIVQIPDFHPYIGQLAQRRLDNFPHLKERESVTRVDTDLYTSKVELLLKSFNERFSEFTREEMSIALFNNPFTFPEHRIPELALNIQPEIIDLKCNSVLKGIYYELSPIPSSDEMIRFWSMLPATLPGLRLFAQRFVCRFGSTYRCEQTFSSMKLIKSKQRSRLTDPNLCSLLVIGTTELTPNIPKLAAKHEAQVSH